jgi:hypothetical protein
MYIGLLADPEHILDLIHILMSIIILLVSYGHFCSLGSVWIDGM